MASSFPVSAAPTDAYESRNVVVTDDGGRVEFSYRLLRPAAVAPATRYPVVLFLHGAGERGHDNAQQLKYLPTWLAEPDLRKRYPCFVVAPQCREEHKWVDVDWSQGESSPQTPEPTADLAAAVAALDAVMKDEAVDPNRIYLTGLSMGGYGTWDLAARMPERFAAILPICGGGDAITAPRIAGLPIWCFHGDADQIVPVERSRRMIAAVKAAGGEPRYSELPGVGHDSWTPAYRDPAVLEWLFNQSR
ncbi:MAG: alpha/beta fold hydrolase [Planctomycetia bacterium]|nr:alpha/beta fold hydrolase [Planctomycetia bacterium]